MHVHTVANDDSTQSLALCPQETALTRDRSSAGKHAQALMGGSGRLSVVDGSGAISYRDNDMGCAIPASSMCNARWASAHVPWRGEVMAMHRHARSLIPSRSDVVLAGQKPVE